MDRAQLALTFLSLESNNATARQRQRVKRQDVQALAIENELATFKKALRELRKSWNRIEKFEQTEREARGLDKPARDKRPGQNRRLTGTFGKTR